MSIQENGLINNSLWMKYARGILKSNEIPNAYFIVNKDLLIMCLQSTVLYATYLPQDTGLYSKVFTAYIDENKEMVPVEVPVNNTESNNYAYYYELVNRIGYHYHIYATLHDVQDDPEFQELMNLKAADGMRFYKVHGMLGSKMHTWFVPVFSGFPSLTKQDKLDITIKKENNYSRYCIVNYHIFKAKVKQHVDMYFTILELQ